MSNGPRRQPSLTAKAHLANSTFRLFRPVSQLFFGHKPGWTRMTLQPDHQVAPGKQHLVPYNMTAIKLFSNSLQSSCHSGKYAMYNHYLQNCMHSNGFDAPQAGPRRQCSFTGILAFCIRQTSRAAAISPTAQIKSSSGHGMQHAAFNQQKGILGD